MITTIHQWAQHFVGSGVCFCAQPVDDYTEQLTASEHNLVAKSVAVRKNTFSSGRLCAKSALSKIGTEQAEYPDGLLRQSDGSVAWPTGCVGSISHTNDWAMAAVTHKGEKYRSVGIDVERIDRVGKDVLRLIATDQEQEQLESAQSIRWGRVGLFSIKESLYKCLRPIYGEFIRFHDVELSHLDRVHAPTELHQTPNELPLFYHPTVRLLRTDLAEKCDEQRIDIRLAVLDEHVVSFVGYHA